jgi:hypothetical protein
MLSLCRLWLLLQLFWGFIRKYLKNVQDKVAESQVVVEETMQGIILLRLLPMNGNEIVRYNGK